MVLVLKLFFLAVRQASKPIANSFKEAAHRSDGVLKPLAVGLGRGVDRLQTQVGRLSEGKAPLLKVAPLEEEKALARGAETLSELIIYSVAGVTVGLEYSRCASSSLHARPSREPATSRVLPPRHVAADNKRRRSRRRRTRKQRSSRGSRRTGRTRRASGPSSRR
jgi:hypothetical protein